MIKFFRHIRRSLIQENKMGKYFKYAIGEILLVMVGILLALQVNNWNENRKAKTFEENMLSEIYETLNSDIEIFGRFEERIRNKDSAIDNLLYARAGKKEFTNAELKDDVFWAGASILFSYNDGPYEALKSSGLDKIRTDSLRYRLTDYYEVYLPRAISFIQDTHDEYEPPINKMINRFREDGFFEEYLELIVEDSIEKGYAPRTKYNIDKYLTEPYYEEYLILNAHYKSELWWMLKSIISRSKQIREAVKQELKERFNHDL